MTSRTTTPLAAFLLASLPWTFALAQPVPAPPDTPPADKPAQPAPDKPAQPAPDKPPADVAPEDKPAVDPTAPPVKVEPAAPKSVLVPVGPQAGTAPVIPLDVSDPDAPPEHTVSFSSNGFTVWPRVLIQAQATPYIGENASFVAGDIAERAGFRLRRARFGFGARYARVLEAQVSTELSTDPNTGATIPDAWLGFTPKPYFGAYMGMLTVPFSRAALIGSAETELIDRSLAVRAFSPFQQLGALVGGSVAGGRLHYSAGIFNGFHRSDVFYSGYRQSVSGLGNRFDNMAYAVRVASSLDTPGPDIPLPGDTKNRFNVGASYFFSDGGARDIHSVEGDLFFQRGGFHALAEVLYSATTPESVPTEPTLQTAAINSLGIVAEGGYTFRRSLGGNLRFEWIDPNTAVDDASDNWLLTVGISFAPPVIGKYAKAQLEYTHREEVSGKSLANDSITLQTQFVLQ